MPVIRRRILAFWLIFGALLGGGIGWFAGRWLLGLAIGVVLGLLIAIRRIRVARGRR